MICYKWTGRYTIRLILPCSFPFTLDPRASSRPLDWPDFAVTAQAIINNAQFKIQNFRNINVNYYDVVFTTSSRLNF